MDVRNVDGCGADPELEKAQMVTDIQRKGLSRMGSECEVCDLNTTNYTASVHAYTCIDLKWGQVCCTGRPFSDLGGPVSDSV